MLAFVAAIFRSSRKDFPKKGYKDLLNQMTVDLLKILKEIFQSSEDLRKNEILLRVIILHTKVRVRQGLKTLEIKSSTSNPLLAFHPFSQIKHISL